MEGTGRRNVTHFWEEHEGMGGVYLRMEEEGLGTAGGRPLTGGHSAERNMGRLEAVNGDVIGSGTQLEEKGMGIALKDLVGTTVGWS